MSSSMVTFRFGKNAASSGAAQMHSTTAKRNLHRSADFTYVKLWNEKGGFSLGGGTASKNMHDSPSLVERTMKTMTAMGEKGYTPFLHAMPAASRVVRKFTAVILPVGDRHYKYLRSPSGYQESLTEVSSNTAPTGIAGGWRSDLLSMSYGLTSGVEPLESAASWGFQNHFGKEQNFSMSNLYRDTLDKSGLDPKSESYNHFWKRGRDLIRDYSRLGVGDFLVIGVPKKDVDKFAYDSSPFNIPTGEKASSVADNPERHKQSLFKQRTHMATLRLCRETVSPESSIRMVDAHDEREVEMFCSGMKFKKMGEIQEFRGLVSTSPTHFEKNQLERRKELDRNLETLAKDFETYRRNPIKPLPSYKEQEEEPCSLEWLP